MYNKLTYCPSIPSMEATTATTEGAERPPTAPGRLSG